MTTNEARGAGMDDMHGAPRTWTRPCGRCGTEVTRTGFSGPPGICQRCADGLLAVVMGPAYVRRLRSRPGRAAS